MRLLVSLIVDAAWVVRELARTWLQERHLVGCAVRFDVVSVLWPPGGEVRIEHREEVF